MSKEQIEEMAKVIDEFTEPLSARDIHKAEFSEQFAEALYNAGYRKQSEGEWVLEHETYGRMFCSNCNGEALTKHEYNDERKGHLVYVDSSFCPNCGAHMKGE